MGKKKGSSNEIPREKMTVEDRLALLEGKVSLLERGIKRLEGVVDKNGDITNKNTVRIRQLKDEERF